MPWLETDPMDQRLRFLEDVRLSRLSMTEICAHYQIARKTGDKWIDRAAHEGRRGRANRSRAPHHCPHRSGSAFLYSETGCDNWIGGRGYAAAASGHGVKYASSGVRSARLECGRRVL